MNLHFVGVCGMGMSALALYMKKLGHHVSGSDVRKGEMFYVLQREGIDVYVGSREIEDVDVVIKSSAVGDDDLEVLSAHAKGVSVLERMEFFVEHVHPTVGVTGTDGKSSTSCMISWIASKCGLDPTLLCGAICLDSGVNFKSGGKMVVAEVDESDPKFRKVESTIAVLTNLRYDHLERYSNDREKQRESIEEFLERAIYTVVPNSFEYNCTLSFGREGDVKYEIVESEFNLQRFSMTYKGRKVDGELPIVGSHQVENASAAVSVAILLGINFEDAVKSLKGYKGLKRRLEILRSFPMIVSDYAHTPYEILAAIDAISLHFHDILVVFEPHRYSRFQRDFDGFVNVLSKVSTVVVTDVFGAFEEKIALKVDGFIEALKNKGVHAFHCDISDVEYLLRFKRDVYLFVGAGRIDDMAREFAKML